MQDIIKSRPAAGKAEPLTGSAGLSIIRDSERPAGLTARKRTGEVNAMIDAAPKAETFKLRTPLVSKGRLDTVLTESPLMQVRMKVYAEGGENVLHAHQNEDHIFVI